MEKDMHVGVFLLEEIEARKIKKSDFAKQIGILPHHLSAIFSGKRNISIKVAIKIEKQLGVSAEYWLGLQLQSELEKFRKKNQ